MKKAKMTVHSELWEKAINAAMKEPQEAEPEDYKIAIVSMIVVVLLFSFGLGIRDGLKEARQQSGYSYRTAVYNNVEEITEEEAEELEADMHSYEGYMSAVS